MKLSRNLTFFQGRKGREGQGPGVNGTSPLLMASFQPRGCKSLNALTALETGEEKRGHLTF